MTEITDLQAVEALHEEQACRAQPCNTFATRTIIYPVETERRAGVKKIEPRIYVLMGSWYPERKWEKALDVEKRYALLNKEFRAGLKARNLTTDRKAPANLLNVEQVEIG